MLRLYLQFPKSAFTWRFLELLQENHRAPEVFPCQTQVCEHLVALQQCTPECLVSRSCRCVVKHLQSGIRHNVSKHKLEKLFLLCFDSVVQYTYVSTPRLKTSWPIRWAIYTTSTKDHYTIILTVTQFTCVNTMGTQTETRIRPELMLCYAITLANLSLQLSLKYT